MVFDENEQGSRIKRNIMFILSHFKHQNELFPRTIMTSKIGGQKVIYYKTDIQGSINQIYDYFKEANFVDCRINGFPFITEYSIDLQIKNRTPADFFMIDLDLKDFESKEKLDSILKKTIRTMSQAFHSKSYPTVLWTGNGYHVYQPIEGFVLEKERVFFDFVKHLQKDLTSEFLRFAGPYFTGSNNDKYHMPSIRSCLLRIPGTLNSKNMQEIKVIKEWSGTRPAINYILRDFRRYLIQRRISSTTNKANRSGSYGHYYTFSKSKNTVMWIEKLLTISIQDFRKCSVNLILSPYLINVRKISYLDAFRILIEWLSKCNQERKLDFVPNNLIKSSLDTAIRKGIHPMRLETLKEKNIEIYQKISL